MDKSAQIRKKLQEAVGFIPNLPITGTVAAISGETCTVELVSGLKVTDVKLKSVVTEATEQLLITPVLGSTVVMISADGTVQNLWIIKYDKVDKWQLKTEGLTVHFDGTDNKVAIKNQSTSLYSLFDKLTTLLKQLKVYTPNGPSGTPLPDSIVAITEVETLFKQLLKEN